MSVDSTQCHVMNATLNGCLQVRLMLAACPTSHCHRLMPPPWLHASHNCMKCECGSLTIRAIRAKWEKWMKPESRPVQWSSPRHKTPANHRRLIYQLPREPPDNNTQHHQSLECGPMPNVMAALPNIGGVLCSTPQGLADAHYSSAMQ